jgi:hypothetical protein
VNSKLPPKKGPGPEPERVKIDGDWRDAMAEALKKPPLTKTKPRKRKN